MVRCEVIRDAVSALVDGEAAPVDDDLVAEHLRTCGACRRYRAVAERARRVGLITAASTPPDLSRQVAKRAAVADRAGAGNVARTLLGVVAVQLLVLAGPSLAATDDDGGAAHDARHLGAFTIAYAVALLVVVVRPARARAVLPVAVVLAGGLLITALVDVVNGNVPFVDEARHLPQLLSVGLLWFVAPRPHREPTRDPATTTVTGVTAMAPPDAGRSTP